MDESELRIGVEYDELVDAFILPSVPMQITTLVDLLRELGIATVGDRRVYWPGDSYVPADRISERAADVLGRLFQDPRLVFGQGARRAGISGATFETDSPRRKISNGYATLSKDGRPARLPYKVDRQFLGTIHAAPVPSGETAPRRPPAPQAAPGTRFVYVGDEPSDQ